MYILILFIKFTDLFIKFFLLKFKIWKIVWLKL